MDPRFSRETTGYRVKTKNTKTGMYVFKAPIKIGSAYRSHREHHFTTNLWLVNVIADMSHGIYCFWFLLFEDRVILSNISGFVEGTCFADWSWTQRSTCPGLPSGHFFLLMGNLYIKVKRAGYNYRGLALWVLPYFGSCLQKCHSIQGQHYPLSFC